MAFNNTYYPQYYQNYQNPYMGQTQMSNPQMTQASSQVQQIHNGGFVPAPNEDFARNYPVAPGNSVSFKDENAPYVYTKTMGFSQLDRPVFEKYRLIKEDDATNGDTETENVVLESVEFLKSEVDKLKATIGDIKEDTDKLWDEVNALKRKPTTKRKEDVGD